MATLQKIRSKGPLLVGVIALGIFAFIAGDAFKIFQPRQPHDVGEVDGKALSIAEYQQMVEEFTTIQKSMYGQNSLSEDESNQIKDMVWNTYVNNQLIANEAEKLGLVVTKTELANVLDEGSNSIFNMFPMFFNEQTGRFDKDKLFMFLAEYANLSKTTGVDPNYMASMHQIHSFWAFAERSLVEEKLGEKYLGLINAALSTNKVEVESSFEGRIKQADLHAAIIPFADIDESLITVTDADLKKEYDKNLDRFKQQMETRMVKYIDVKINPSVEDVQELEAEVSESVEALREADADYATIINSNSGSEIAFNDIYLSLELYPEDVIARVNNSVVGETYGPFTNAQDATINAFKVIDKKNLPDSIEFRMLQVQAFEAEALVKKTDSIVNVLNSGGDFSAIAEEEQQSAEAFWISERTIANQEQFLIYSTLSTMGVNEIKTLPMQTGNIILQVTNRKSFKEKYKLAIVKRTMEISSETANKAYNEFSQFVSQFTTVNDIIEKAEDAGYQLSTQELNTNMHNLGNINSTKEAVRWVFDSKVGDLSNIYECGDRDHLLVVGVTDIIPEGYRPLKYVKDNLRYNVVNDKKADYIASEVEKLNASSIDQLTAINGAVVDTIKHVSFSTPAFVGQTRSNEPAISGYAAVGKENVLSGAIKGQAGMFVLSTIAQERSEEEFDPASEKAKVEQELLYLTNGRTIIQDLIQKAKITDRRYLYF